MNVKFTECQKESFSQMAKALGTNEAGVLAKALALLKVTIREQQQNNKIAVVKNGKIIKIIAEIK